MKTTICFLLPVLTACLFVTNAKADDAHLKETLRTLTLRLRSAETERNNLLSEKAQFDQEKKTLMSKMDALTKQAAADKKQLDELTAKVDAQEKELGETKESLGKWKTSYDQIAVAAKKSEAERAKLASESIVLQRKLEDRERKNLELFRIGNEILRRYEKFGLGEALTAKEPFTGLTRVKLENLVQGYEDALADQRVKPDAK
jgi:chromosome segregation ATPase